jgi:5,10-methylenetetrahydromethanopterin reductase
MRISVYFDGFAEMAEVLEAASAAEQAGAMSLWFAQHMGFRDAFMSAAATAAVSHKVELVPTAISIYTWPPLQVAMAMATLDELARGRAVLSIAVGNILNLSQSGFEPLKPLAVMREYVQTLRALFAGEAVHLDGAFSKLSGAHLEFQKGLKIPIMIASTGPRMLQLAGQIADGVVLSAGLTLAMTRKCLAEVATGGQSRGGLPSAFRKTGFINLAVSEDGTSARAAVRRKLAHLFRSTNHAENIKSSGLDIDHAGIIAAVARHDLDAATELLSDEAASAFACVGTPRECRERLQEYLAIGLDEVVIAISGDSEARRLALELIRETAAAARNS